MGYHQCRHNGCTPIAQDASVCPHCGGSNPAVYIRTKVDIISDRKGYLFWMLAFAAGSVLLPEHAPLFHIGAAIYLYSLLNTIIPLTQILVLLFFLWLFTNIFGS